MVNSKANISSTKQFCEKFPSLLHKQLGSTGLTVSACGFGAYRVDYRYKGFSEALAYAVKKGINLIDTSSNYSDGGSEVLIGSVLDQLINTEQSLSREEIVIVTKGGYLQGKNLEAAKKMEEDGVGYKNVVKYTDELWHCIHPDYLKDTITFSLERMKIEVIDVFLLHNPEYFLDSPMAKELETDEIRYAYHNRLKQAFEYLEEEVKRGRIGCYGISSNTFVREHDDPTFTSLQECLKLAEEVSTENNFRVIQFPLNLYERGAVLTKNQLGETSTLLQLAEKNNLGVLVNRPLNAIGANGLTRLADFTVNNEYVKLDEAQIIAEINLLDSMEEDFTKEYIDTLNLTPENTAALKAFMKAGQLLKENWKNFGTIESFNDVKNRFIIPRANYSLMVLNGAALSDEMKLRLEKIPIQLNKLMDIISSIYGLQANLLSKNITAKLDELVGSETFTALSLSQKAIAMINSLDTVSSTLVGMRNEKYVDDVIGALEFGKIDDAVKKWENFSI